MFLFRSTGSRFGNIALIATQGIALLSLIFALPGYWTHITRIQGLSISCSLFLLYLLQATFSIFTTTTSSSRQRYAAFKIFHLLEWPILMLTLYFGWRWLPLSLTLVYEKYILYPSAPFLILLEGVCYLLVILAITFDSEYYNSSISDIHDYSSDDDDEILSTWTNRFLSFLKNSLAMIIFILSCIAMWILILDPNQTYFASTMSVSTSALLSSVLTLYFISLFLALYLHLPLLQPVLLIPYIIYNLWMIRRSISLIDTTFDDYTSISDASSNWFDIPGWFSSKSFEFHHVSPSFLFSSLQTSVERFTVEMILQLLFRLGIYILSSRLVQRLAEQVTNQEDSDTENGSFVFQELNLLSILNVFGKCCLVLVYTLSWLEGTESNYDHYSLSIWRWANLYIFIVMYMYYLYCRMRQDEE